MCGLGVKKGLILCRKLRMREHRAPGWEIEMYRDDRSHQQLRCGEEGRESCDEVGEADLYFFICFAELHLQVKGLVEQNTKTECRGVLSTV
jgi:hypothetical protein